LLINFGADVEDKGRSRNPAIIAALEGGHLEVFEYLVDQIGADVNSTNCDENTCLHISVNLKVESIQYQLQIIRSIIDRGINQTKVNRKGLTALQLALLDHNRVISQELGARFSNGGEVVLTEDLLLNMPLSFTNPIVEQPNYLSTTTSSVMYKKTTEAIINSLPKNTAAVNQGNGSTSIRVSNESITRTKASTINIDSRKSTIPLIQRTDLMSSTASTRTVQKFTSKLRRQVTTDEQALQSTNAVAMTAQLNERVDNVMKAEQVKNGNGTVVDGLQKVGEERRMIAFNTNAEHQSVSAEEGSLFTEVHVIDGNKIVLTTDDSTMNKPRSYKMMHEDDKTRHPKSEENNDQSSSMDSIQLLEKASGDVSSPLLLLQQSSTSQQSHVIADHKHEVRRKFPRSSGRDVMGRLRAEDSLFDDSSMSIISGVTFDNQ